MSGGHLCEYNEQKRCPSRQASNACSRRRIIAKIYGTMWASSPTAVRRPVRLLTAAFPKKKAPNGAFFFGAADGSRTHLSSLGSLHSTDELQPHCFADSMITHSFAKINRSSVNRITISVKHINIFMRPFKTNLICKRKAQKKNLNYANCVSRLSTGTSVHKGFT